jgi:Leucine-rich repeat (LRR) protein
MILSSGANLTSLTLSNTATSATLEVVARFCPRLEELIFTTFAGSFDGVDDTGILALAKGCPLVTHLCCRDCPKITAAGIANAVVFWPNLKQLVVRSLDGVAASALAESCPILESLDAMFCSSLTDADVQTLSKCRQLTTLRLRQCPLITSTALKSISKLRTLDLVENPNIDNDAVKALLTHFPQLTELSLWNCSRLQKEIAIHALEHGEHLTALALSNSAGPMICPMSALAEQLVRNQYPRIRYIRLYFAAL